MAEWSQDRVVLHRDLDIIEVDFSDLRMACAEDADAIYDQMDRIISAAVRASGCSSSTTATAGSCPMPG